MAATSSNFKTRLCYTLVSDLLKEMEYELAVADVFVFPSLRDTSGAAVLEAMAMELPVICFDHQGSAIMVIEDCGLKVAAGSTHEAINNLSDAMNQLSGDQEQRTAMGILGRKRVAGEYDWGSKVARISNYYEELGADSESEIGD